MIDSLDGADRTERSYDFSYEGASGDTPFSSSEFPGPLVSITVIVHRCKERETRTVNGRLLSCLWRC